MGNKKMGRPTEDPKQFNTRIRMSEKEVEILEYCSKQTGLSKADVIRKGLKMVYESIKNKE